MMGKRCTKKLPVSSFQNGEEKVERVVNELND